MRLRKRKIRSKPFNTIDLTSMMDLTFMLLVVFVITVPVIEYATDVTPPELNSQTPVEQIEDPVVISLNEAGVVSLDAQSVAMHELGDHLIRMRQPAAPMSIS